MWWLEKYSYKVFHKQTHFQFKTPRKFVKPIYNLQKCKKKKDTKTKINLKTKIFPILDLFFRHLQGKKKKKKTHHLNFSYHIEPFDTKIDHFSSRNCYWWPLSFSMLESSDSFSLLLTQNDWKIRKIKFGTKFYFVKN